MEKKADDILQDKAKDATCPDNMLEEADKLNRDGVGRHLNFMGMVYNETSPQSPMDEDLEG